MGIESRVFPEQNLEIVTWKGVLSPEEVVAHVFEQMRDPALPPPFDCIYDGREVEVVVRDEDDVIRQLASFHNEDLEWISGHRNAFVVPGGALYGLVRMFIGLAQSSPVSNEVFRDMASAREWLGLPYEEEAG